MTVAAAAAITPAWAGVFVEWIHPASLICALLFPLVRGFVLRWNRLPLRSGMWFEAGASGLSFPSFVALPISIISPNIRAHLDGHVLALAGLIGVIYTIANLIKIERDDNHNRFS